MSKCLECGKTGADITDCDVCNGLTRLAGSVFDTQGSIGMTLSWGHYTPPGEVLKPMIDCETCGQRHTQGECAELGGNVGTSSSRAKERRTHPLPPRKKRREI